MKKSGSKGRIEIVTLDEKESSQPKTTLHRDTTAVYLYQFINLKTHRYIENLNDWFIII